jgi:tetratricopeptide (TPR) repeat protein
VRKQPQAQQAADRALELRQQLATDFPSVVQYRSDLAASQFAQAMLLNADGKRLEAEQLLRKALETREQLAAEFPNVPQHRERLSETCNNLAIVLRAQERVQEAQEAHRRAMQIREELVQQFPQVPEYRVDLASSCYNLGLLLTDATRVDEALQCYDRAVNLLTPVVSADPRGARERRMLAGSHRGRGRSLMAQARYAEAMVDWERSLELDNVERAYVRVRQAACLARLMRPAEAVAAAEAIFQEETLKVTAVFNLACVCSVAATNTTDEALREAYAARAVQFLRDAAQRGFKDVAAYEQDPDLAGLREREDYRKLLTELKPESNPR